MSGDVQVPDRSVLQVEGLEVSYRVGAPGGGATTVPALRGVDLAIAPGEKVALVGESGSGKSTLAHAVIGLLAENARVDAGRIGVAGTDVTGWDEQRLRQVRGRTVGLVPQDPSVSLNPVKRIGDQVIGALRAHRRIGRARARELAVGLLERAGLDRAEARLRQYPHELSGGMRQRVLIAIAIAGEPRLIIADEPTSALDVTVQRRILDHLDQLVRDEGLSVLLVTHDLGVAADRADRIVVMQAGRVVESGPTERLLADPQHAYTRRLLASAPGLGSEDGTAVPRRPASPSGEARVLVRARNLVKEFTLRGRSGGGTVRAVDDVDLTVHRGRTLGLVGESGSGKSTTARLLLRLSDPTSGTVEFDGEDITSVRGEAWRTLRRRAQLVYQNPYGSLDPRFSIEEVVTEPLRAFSVGSRTEQREVAAGLLERVALPRETLRRKPAELSGGQRQRVAIARALALSPDLVVCDEAVSALDVSVQAQVLDLLVDLQESQELAYLFITHDLGVVRQIAHEVAVMRAGRVVESGPTEALFTTPEHPYTRELLSAIAGRGRRTADVA